MNWPTHSAYKDSGVQWLGEVPAHWGLSPMFTVGNERTVRNAGLSETNLLSLSYGRIVRKDIDTTDGLLPGSFDTYQIVEPRDIVFRFTDLQNDKRSLRSALVPERGIITSAYMAFSPTKLNPRYFSYLMRSYDLTKVFYSRGGGLRQSLKYEDVKRLPILVPPTDEQRVISRFLDRETANIDALIDKQEQLIATLREDRAATISHAVTKGLNPDVEMKEAEAPWIGEIPAHWGATKFSRLGKFTSGSGFPHEYQGQADNEIAFLKVNALGRANHSGYITTRDDTVSPGTARELGAKIFDANTVVFAKVGAALLLGRICLTASKSCIDNNMMAFVPNSSILPEYARYLLQQIPFDLLVNPGAVPSVNEGQLRGLPAAHPPVAEQLAIVSHLAERCQKIDVLIDVSIEMIEALREYRSALITNAVTGKIDVREAV